MSEIENKTKEIAEKWKSKMQEQGIDKFTYKFYRQNQVELFEDFGYLWTLCKLEDLKQAIKTNLYEVNYGQNIKD